MSDAAATLTSAEAMLFVTDIEASCTFFAEKLGFTPVFVHGDPPFYGQVRRDAARLNLRLVCEPVYAGDIREREQLLAASMTVGTTTELEQLFHQYQKSDVDFFQQLRLEPWGARTFIVRDPDGNLLLFAGPTT